MTINKCDICKQEVKTYDTIVLHKLSFDYCEKCKNKAEKIKQQFQNEVNYENIMLNIHLKNKEHKMIKNIDKSIKKC